MTQLCISFATRRLNYEFWNIFCTTCLQRIKNDYKESKLLAMTDQQKMLVGSYTGQYSKSTHIRTYQNKNIEAVFPKLCTLQLRTCFSLMKHMFLLQRLQCLYLIAVIKVSVVPVGFNPTQARLFETLGIKVPPPLFSQNHKS